MRTRPGTDLRKAINGLSVIVQKRLRIDPFEPSLFVFCNRSRNRLKIPEWDGDGFWMYVLEEMILEPEERRAKYLMLESDTS